MANGRPSAVTRWSFTLNNPNYDNTTPDLPHECDVGVRQALSAGKGYRYLVFQLEQGDNGTPHYQGYVEFNSRLRLTAVRKLLSRAHWEPALGTSAHNLHYCTKPVPGCGCSHCVPPPVRLAGPWIDGTPGEERQKVSTKEELGKLRTAITGGKRKRELLEDPDLSYMCARFPKYVDNLYELFPPQRDEDLNVTLLYGPTGCGKTYEARQGPIEDLWVQPIGGQGWYNGYDGQPTALFDDFGGSSSHTRLDDLLRLLHEWIERVPVKGGYTWWRPKQIFITTNLHPWTWYEWKDRESQYPALQRRVTSVVTWRSDGTDRRRAIRGTVEFEAFWKTYEIMANSAPPERADGPMGGYLIRSRPGDELRKFDWIYE